VNQDGVPTLSVVIPTYDERPDRLTQTLRALDLALEGSGWREPELVIVDDGSSPPVAVPKLNSAEVRLIRQQNRGRFEARRVGIEAAHGEHVLLLDARVTLDPAGLRWVADQVAKGAQAWNGHSVTDGLASPYARFWDIILRAAWSDYLRDPKTTSFGIRDYDRYPKGTGHFLAPRSWLLEALADFDSLYADSSLASDDTHLLRSIARRDRIHISPHFGSSYGSRESFVPFIRHTLRRGTTFFDGHSRRDARFRPVALGALPVSLFGTVIAVRHPRIGIAGLGALGLVGALFATRQGRSTRDAASFGALVPPFAIVYSAGLWRGVFMALRERDRKRLARSA
jgi:glycosyltransferase involved in cell wall biosynthesis